MTVSPSVLATLESMPNVKYISPNRKNQGFLDLTTLAVNANFAWPLGWDGTGAGVAVIDSGIALKHDLTGADGTTSRVVHSESFVISRCLGGAELYKCTGCWSGNLSYRGVQLAPW